MPDMSNQEKQQLYLAFMSELLSDGKKKAKSKRLKLHQGKEDITLKAIQEPLSLQLELPLSTLVSVVERNPKTLKDKSMRSKKDTLHPRSLVKSEGDSISNVPSYLPYWNESCQEMSKQLWSLIETEQPDLDLTGLNGFVENSTVKSWFSIHKTCLLKPKWLRTSLPSSTVLVADSTDSENIKLLSRKIQIYPSSELKKVWNKWIAACRYCFNQAIAYQKENGKIGRGKLRNIIMQSKLPEWIKETPCHIRQNAVFDAHQAYVASKDCKYRSCKSPRQTIKFNNCNYSKSKWYPQITKGLDFQSSESIPKNSSYATQIIKNKSGEWFAIFLEETHPVQSESEGVIFLDPGVRAFLTGFDGQSFIEIGKGDIGRINRLCSHLDDLMSRISLSKISKQRQKMRKSAARLRNKIRNLVDEAHKQIANYLTNNYKLVVLPTFETSQMTKKAKRKIRSKTARNMLSWAHYRFKQVLKNKAELSGCQVIDVTEEFTSKTCTKCGHVHQKLGGSKIFKCPVCSHTILRDFNGALGITLKALSDTTFATRNDGNAIVVEYDNLSCCTA